MKKDPMQIKCCQCQHILTAPGALVFGVPNDQNQVFKYHICAECFSIMGIGMLKNAATDWVKPDDPMVVAGKPPEAPYDRERVTALVRTARQMFRMFAALEVLDINGFTEEDRYLITRAMEDLRKAADKFQ